MREALPHRDFAGIQVVCAHPDRVIEKLQHEIDASPSRGRVVHLLSTHAVAEAHRNPDFFASLQDSAWVIPDGRWLQILTRRSASPLQQLRGQDLFQRIIEPNPAHTRTHYFLLSTEPLLVDLSNSPALESSTRSTIAGEAFPHGPLGPRERTELAERVVASGAQVVWFGISSPRQNIEAQWISELTQKTVICVGAALEFSAGQKPVAPRWVQRLGGEWIYRLLSEPRRLGRRYIFDSLFFARIAWRHRGSVFT